MPRIDDIDPLSRSEFKEKTCRRCGSRTKVIQEIGLCMDCCGDD